MAVERIERGLQFDRQAERIEFAGFAAALLRHLRADMLPQLAEFRHVAAGDVVGDRHARQFDDAAFDRVHQREVADRPREQRALGIARAAQEERRRRQIVDGGEAELALDGLDARDPQPRRLVVLFRLLLVLALELFAVVGLRLLAVAVMRLVVEDDDVLQPHQVAAGALQHLAFGFERVQRGAAPLQQRAPGLGHLHVARVGGRRGSW